MDSMNEEKLKALIAIQKSLGKEFSEPNLIMLGLDPSLTGDYEVIPTGSLGLDLATCVGGWPEGRIFEIYGPASAGKTTIVLSSIAACQKMGKTAAYVDSEHAFDIKYARALGVDTSKLIISQPDYGEKALEVVDVLAKSGLVDFIGVDSVSALTPKAIMEKGMDESTVGEQARLMSKAMGKLTSSVYSSKSRILFTNQIRYKIGGYGNPETVSGGNALGFFASIRVEIRKQQIKGSTVANRVTMKVTKNKVGVPFQECEADMIWGQGIDFAGEVIDQCTARGIITVAGSWFTYGELRKQGRDGIRELLEANPDLVDELHSKLMLKIKNG